MTWNSEPIVLDNVMMHNVSYCQRCSDGWRLYRAPQPVWSVCNAGLATSAAYSTGVELRFCMQSDSVEILLRTEPIAEGQMAYVYYGSLQGGWQQSAYVINPEETVLRIPRPRNMAQLQAITDAAHLPFSPEVVRVVLPYGNTIFIGVRGDVTPPRPDQMPRRTLLSYGSSITHGSLALAAPYAYPFRIAQKLGMDTLNKGFAGTCQCERAMAEWLVSNRDWHAATLELGINMMGMDETEFERRIDEFTGIMAEDGRPVFATSIFVTAADTPTHRQFREIVRKYAEPRLHFVDGLALLNRPEFISQDGVHPSLEGIMQIAESWANIIQSGLPADFFDDRKEFP